MIICGVEFYITSISYLCREKKNLTLYSRDFMGPLACRCRAYRQEQPGGIERKGSKNIQKKREANYVPQHTLCFVFIQFSMVEEQNRGPFWRDDGEKIWQFSYFLKDSKSLKILLTLSFFIGKMECYCRVKCVYMQLAPSSLKYLTVEPCKC